MKFLLILLSVFALCFYATAQLTFIRVDTVIVIDDSLPLKNAWAGGLNFPMVEPIDLNGDGTLDLVLYEQGNLPGHDRLIPFINGGDSGVVDYQFAPKYISCFPPIYEWLETYDYNCDGKLDLFMLSKACSCGIMVYRNDFTVDSGLKFTEVVDPVYAYYGPNGTQPLNITSNSSTFPAISDVDGDGAMDFIAWPPFPNGCISYFRGLWVDSGWSCDSLRFNMVTDSWGDVNLTQGSNFANLGTECAPERLDSSYNWNAATALQDDTQSCLCVYEQDSTLYQKKDAVIGGYADNNMIYLHNSGNAPLQDTMNYEDPTWPKYNVPVNLPSFPCAYYVDVDNDGRKDMIISPHSVNDFRGVLFYKNTDLTSDTGIFTRQPHTFLQEEMIDVGTGSAPQLFDYDADGLPDLLVGDGDYYDTSGVYHKGITVYKNIGTPSEPKFQLKTRDYAGIDALNGVGGTLCPTFGDLRGNGVMDMIVGMGDGPTNITGNGHLLYYQNTAAVGSPASFVLVSTFYDSIDVGGNSAPQLYDLNHDGLLDLIVGNTYGVIKYYQNYGSSTSPLFNSTPTKDTLGGINVVPPGGIYLTGYANPFIYNDNGVDKLVVGTEDGEVYVYDSINGNIFGNYHLADSLINGEDGQDITLTIGDINNDGHPDMIVGNYDGGLYLYMNSDTATGINELPQIVLPSFNAYPNPASDELYLSFYHIEGEHALLEIYNNIGQLIYTSAVTEPQMTIPLQNLANGLYLVHFVCTNNTQTLKIIVRR